MPVSGLWQTPIQPCSGMQVLPSMTAPCSRRRATAGESACAGAGSVVVEPRRVGSPLTQMLSLIEDGTPSIGPSGLPARQRASDSAAAFEAVSESTTTKALMAVWRSMRARQSRATSTGESAPRR